MKTATVVTVAMAAAMAQAGPLAASKRQSGGVNVNSNNVENNINNIDNSVEDNSIEINNNINVELDFPIERDLELELGLLGGHMDYFTSVHNLIALPDQVVDDNDVLTGGLAGAKGMYKFGINSRDNVICYKIALSGFAGEYESPALSATHIHQAAHGKAGPPR